MRKETLSTSETTSVNSPAMLSVKAGGDPVGLFWSNGAPIPTNCNDTVVRVPPAKTPELDKKLLRETGRRLADGYLEEPPLMAAQ
jgi:hypothetical protein